jgi:hypothetical protein
MYYSLFLILMDFQMLSSFDIVISFGFPWIVHFISRERLKNEEHVYFLSVPSVSQVPIHMLAYSNWTHEKYRLLKYLEIYVKSDKKTYRINFDHLNYWITILS